VAQLFCGSNGSITGSQTARIRPCRGEAEEGTEIRGDIVGVRNKGMLFLVTREKIYTLRDITETGLTEMSSAVGNARKSTLLRRNE